MVCFSWNKSNRLDLMREEHVQKYGEKFGTHISGIAAKTGNNVFFAGAQIPTRKECDDSSAKSVSLAQLFEEA